MKNVHKEYRLWFTMKWKQYNIKYYIVDIIKLILS